MAFCVYLFSAMLGLKPMIHRMATILLGNLLDRCGGPCGSVHLPTKVLEGEAEPVARRAAGFARERLMLVSIRQQLRLAIWCPRGPRGSGITRSPGAATAGVTSAPKSPGAAEPFQHGPLSAGRAYFRKGP